MPFVKLSFIDFSVRRLLSEEEDVETSGEEDTESSTGIEEVIVNFLILILETPGVHILEILRN